MKELDFDELDRAVSSLMSDTTKISPSSTDDTQEKMLEIKITEPMDTKVSFDTLESSLVKKAIEQPTDDETPLVAASVPGPAVRRSSGRFMDVVHPSSDMKQSASSLPSGPRVGAMISPVTPPLVVTSVPLKVIEAPIEESAQPEIPAIEAVESAQEVTHNWPDPLDLATPEEETPAIEEIPVNKEQPSIDEEKAPLSSPFLTDAKVEKRPLGTNAPADIQPADLFDQEDTESQVINTPLPEEYQQDLVAIESGEANSSPDVPVVEAVQAVSVETTPGFSSAESAKPAKALIPDHFSDEDVPKGPSSIAQQYREEPTTSDTSNGSIYDTDTYHTPLAHPVKKKSGWLWIVWIVLILALGAGVGAGLYYLGIVK